MKDRQLYLFDIDGTLIATGGAGGSAMRAAFAWLWKRDQEGFAGIEYSGRTDRAIFRDAHRLAGFDDDAFDAQLQRFKRAYFRRLSETLPAFAGQVLPGVREALNALRADDNATIGLGTGNFRHSAGMKLRHYGLDDYFCCGGFGDGSEAREDLIEDAVRSGRRFCGRRATVFVIGDTEHDVRAARANDVIAVGVASGSASEEELARAGADIVLSSLEAFASLLPDRP
jgi:phosphoglycolate phosphatase-like HAD superfamily hydrolase